LTSLKELIQWCKSQQNQIVIKKQELQPDLNLITRQINDNKVFTSNIEYKKPIIESSLASAKLYYDDRVKFIELSTRDYSIEKDQYEEGDEQTSQNNKEAQNTNSSNQLATSLSLSNIKKKFSTKMKNEKKLQELKINESNYVCNGENEIDNCIQTDNNEEFDLNDEDNNNLLFDKQKLTPNEIAKHLVNKIDRKVQLLDRLWQELNRQSLNYTNILQNFYQNLQQIYKLFELVNQRLNENEQLLTTINSISEIQNDKLADELERVKNFQLKLSSYQPLIDEMCAKFENIKQELHNCGSTSVNSIFNSKFDDFNTRWSNLQKQLQEKYLHMYSLIESSGASIFLKLNDSVQSPWQRGISVTNKVPYYIK
jgi:hypothetical protein